MAADPVCVDVCVCVCLCMYMCMCMCMCVYMQVLHVKIQQLGRAICVYTFLFARSSTLAHNVCSD